MSIRCNDCGAVAGYGSEIGHKSNCPALARAARIGRMYKRVAKGDDADCTTGPLDEQQPSPQENAEPESEK